MAFGCLNPFCYDEVSDVPEKKSFSLNNIGVIIYYIVKPELLGLGMIYRGMVVDIWSCSL